MLRLVPVLLLLVTTACSSAGRFEDGVVAIEVTSPEGVVRRHAVSYDLEGRRTQEQVSNQAGTVTEETSWTYDEVGQLAGAQRNLIISGDPLPDEARTYAYDSAGQLTAEEVYGFEGEDRRPIVRYVYAYREEGVARVDLESWGDDAWMGSGEPFETYGYDEDGRLTSILDDGEMRITWRDGHPELATYRPSVGGTPRYRQRYLFDGDALVRLFVDNYVDGDDEGAWMPANSRRYTYRDDRLLTIEIQVAGTDEVLRPYRTHRFEFGEAGSSDFYEGPWNWRPLPDGVLGVVGGSGRPPMGDSLLEQYAGRGRR